MIQKGTVPFCTIFKNSKIWVLPRQNRGSTFAAVKAMVMIAMIIGICFGLCGRGKGANSAPESEIER